MKLKYKFIIFFVILLVTELIAVSLFNIKAFENDKLAYVFSSLLESTETSLALLESEVGAQKPNFEILVSSFNFSQNIFPTEAKALLQTNESVSYVEVIGQKNGKSVKLDSLGLPIEGLSFPKDLEENQITKSGIISPFLISSLNDYWGLVYSIRLEGFSYPVYRIMVVYKRNPIQVLLDKGRYFNMFLVDQQGSVIAKPKTFQDELLLKKVEGYISQYLAGVNKSGTNEDVGAFTKEIKDESGVDLLVAMVRSKGVPWGFLSVIEKSKTVEAIEKMKKNAVGVLLILTGLGLILTIILVRTLIHNIELLSRSLVQFSKGELKTKSDISSTDEIGMLSNIFNEMTEKIETLVIENSEKSRMAGELETARSVQRAMVPPNNLKEKEYEIIGHFEPASECGGDWWYYSSHEKGVSLYIADVTGHGVASALLTSALRASISALKTTGAMRVDEFVSSLNKVIHESGRGKLMMTFFMCNVDRETGALEYVNASHCAPAIFRRADPESKEVETIFLDEISGPRLGERLEAKYQVFNVQLRPEDVLFAFTDGLTEFENEGHKAFGEKRAYKKIIKSIQQNRIVNSVKTDLMKEFGNFRKDKPLDDDLTLFFMKYYGKQPEGDNMDSLLDGLLGVSNDQSSQKKSA